MGKVLLCPQCQAPLKWKGVAAVVECCYCNSHVVTGQKVRGQDGGPREDLRGTRTDLPAQVVTIDVSQIRRSFVGPLLSGLLLVGISAAAFVFLQQQQMQVEPPSPTPARATAASSPQPRMNERPATPTIPRTEPQSPPAPMAVPAQPPQPPPALGTRLRSAQVFSVRPSDGPADYAKALGIKLPRRALTVVVPLSDRPFKTAVVSWLKRKKSAHALTLRLGRRGPGFESRLRTTFGPRFATKPSGAVELALAGTTVSLSADGLTFEVRVLAATDPDWKLRFSALWLITGQIASGGLPILDQDAKELVYRGYRIRDMVAFELSAFTRGALNSKVRPPGIVRRDDATFTVPLDNPWMSEATLRYGLRKDGRLTAVTLRPWGKQLAADVVARLMTCLTAALGPPSVGAAGSASTTGPRYRWAPTGLGEIGLTGAGLAVQVEQVGNEAAIAKQSTWNRLWLSTAKCSGESLE